MLQVYCKGDITITSSLRTGIGRELNCRFRRISGRLMKNKPVPLAGEK